MTSKCQSEKTVPPTDWGGCLSSVFARSRENTFVKFHIDKRRMNMLMKVIHEKKSFPGSCPENTLNVILLIIFLLVKFSRYCFSLIYFLQEVWVENRSYRVINKHSRFSLSL